LLDAAVVGVAGALEPTFKLTILSILSDVDYSVWKYTTLKGSLCGAAEADQRKVLGNDELKDINISISEMLFQVTPTYDFLAVGEMKRNITPASHWKASTLTTSGKAAERPQEPCV
jgi:hypothetical protein